MPQLYVLYGVFKSTTFKPPDTGILPDELIANWQLTLPTDLTVSDPEQALFHGSASCLSTVCHNPWDVKSLESRISHI